jgi:lipid-A-disaccharide synthase
MPPTIFISAGEASGEHYGALLIDALRSHLAAAGQIASFLGMGGERMAAAGLERVASPKLSATCLASTGDFAS